MKILMKSLTGMMMRMTVAQRAVVLWMTASAPKVSRYHSPYSILSYIPHCTPLFSHRYALCLDVFLCVPPDCNSELFENTVQLRERRLDLEELLVEERKTADNLRKECDSLVKKVHIF